MRARSLLEPAELIGLRAPWALVGARVWTGAGEPAEAIAFGADGRVAALGGAAEVAAAARDAGAPLVEAGEAFVCPGFVDPHVHVRAGGSSEAGVDLAAATVKGELLDAVAAASAEGRSWVTVTGSNLGTPLLGTAPDRHELDRVSGRARVRVRDRGGHGWLFNTAGLRDLGVDLTATATGGCDRQVPVGVSVERDSDFSATGFVADHVGWVGDRLGPLTERDELARAVGRWSNRLAAAGVVALCDATATNGPAKAASLCRWREERLLRQELSFLGAPEARLEPELERRRVGTKFADASDPRLAPALAAAGPGERVAVHCIDPGETAAALQAAEAASRAGALRIEHAAFVPPDWIPRARAVGATVVTHPSFVHAHGDRYVADPALRPTDWLYRLGSWARGGVPVAFGSDGPFGPIEPLAALRAAAARRTAAGLRIGRDEELVGEAALRALTVTAAGCAGLARHGYGRLAVGGPAAAVVLSHDPRRAVDLDRLRLVATVIDGDVV